MLCCAASIAAAVDTGVCQESVLQRRLALLQLGQFADAYIAEHKVLPDLAAAPIKGLSDRLSPSLVNAHVGGSSTAQAVFYSCELYNPAAADTGTLTVIERCSYSLESRRIDCRNESIMTRVYDSAQ